MKYSIPIILPIIAFSCRSSEPIIQAVDEKPAIREEVIPQKKSIDTQKSNILVDVFYLGGRSYTTSQGRITEQMGLFQEMIALPMGQGTKYIFEKGHIRVLDDEIYMIHVKLPNPKRRSETFQLMGFPEQIDNYIITHREYIVKHEWEFKRFRLFRDAKDNELVTAFEAWKWDPSDR